MMLKCISYGIEIGAALEPLRRQSLQRRQFDGPWLAGGKCRVIGEGHLVLRAEID